MRIRLLHWLVCPICHGRLNIATCESRRVQVTDADYQLLASIKAIQDREEIECDVITGALTCAACALYFPIYNSVPRMLTFPTAVARVHANKNSKWIEQELRDFKLPNHAPAPGETDVLRNFSAEWLGYKWSGRTYWSATPEKVLDWMRFSLGTAKHPLNRKLLLEVGIGIGGIADGLARTEDCEIVGVDLGYAVDQAVRYFGQNARLHPVQASVFALPFRPLTFDVVYSQGVIHHTHSTRAAFSKLAPLTNSDGMLYVWVYSLEDERSSWLRRILMVVEQVLRPILSRLPAKLQSLCLMFFVPLYMIYQSLYRRRHLDPEAPRYGWTEAMHAARDRLTPTFAYRHTYEEVREWFQSELYERTELLRDEALPLGVPRTLQLCVGIRGFRNCQTTSAVRAGYCHGNTPSPAPYS